MSFIGGKRGIAYLDSYTKEQADELFVKKVPLSEVDSVGIPGTAGFGVGVYPHSDLGSLGLTPKFGFEDPASENYGNYIHSNGSEMVFIPKFYYRIGSGNHPRFSTYGANSIEVRGSETFSSDAEANAAGFILHRAFINGGLEKSGFFIDKYVASKHPDNPNIAVSRRLGTPISLSGTTAGLTTSGGMTGCVSQLLDSVTLCKARGTSYQVPTVFMYSALAMLSFAHGQYANSNTYCAWYDPDGITNYPKGCNNNTLGDVDDPSLSFITGGDSVYTVKPLTGSSSNIAKTTHNGQNCGVVDLNGNMWETAIGLTQPGATATGSATIANNIIYLLKESVDVSTLTGDWNTSTSIWGNASNLTSKYDSYTIGLNISGLGGWTAWGNGTNSVFFTQSSGVERALTGVLPPSDAATSANGINLLGKDGVYRYTRENMFMLCGGLWGGGSFSGVFARNLNNFRSNSDGSRGFRGATFGQ